MRARTAASTLGTQGSVASPWKIIQAWSSSRKRCSIKTCWTQTTTPRTTSWKRTSRDLWSQVVDTLLEFLAGWFHLEFDKIFRGVARGWEGRILRCSWIIYGSPILVTKKGVFKKIKRNSFIEIETRKTKCQICKETQYLFSRKFEHSFKTVYFTQTANIFLQYKECDKPFI